jgi:hypothetical protein
MVACANLLLRGSCASLILPSSSGIPALTFVSPTDKRFWNVGEWRSITRLSPVLRILEVDCDLGMVTTAIIGGCSIGERNGIEPWVVLLASFMPVVFILGGGTWVFLGSTSI